MRIHLGKGALLLCLFGFLLVGMFLITNHWGFAIKIANYLYFILLAEICHEIIYHKS